MTESVPQDQLLDSFRYLCNTDNVNNKQLSKQDVDEMRSILKQIPTPQVVNSDPTLHATRTLPKFADRLRQRLQAEQSQATQPPLIEPDEQIEAPQESQDQPDDTQSQISSTSTVRSRRRKPETAEQTKLKKNYLVIINQLKQQGYTITQEYTMDDSIHEIKDEIDQIYSGMECTAWVGKWKSYIENGAQAIEMGSLFIPKTPLQLQGLQQKIRTIHESKQVDIDWQRVYYTMRKRKASNPIVSLIFAYGLAIVGIHGGNWAKTKLSSMGLGGLLGGSNSNGGGNGGIDIMGLLSGLFGGKGGGGGMPNLAGLFGAPPPPSASLTDDLPGTANPVASEQNNNIPPVMNPSNGRGPPRTFQRKVFFK